MRSCPKCNSGFSNWRLFKTAFISAFFLCPNCNSKLTHSTVGKYFNSKSRYSDIPYILSGMIVLGYISNYIPEYQFLLLLLFSIIAYKYYSYMKSEIAICTDEFEEEYKRKMRLHFFLSPKLSPFVGVLTIVCGVLLLLFALASLFSGALLLAIFIIVIGILAIWIGLRLIDGKSFISKHH